MSLDFIKVSANGQLEIDFESLEALTSKEFVEMIKEEIRFDDTKDDFIKIKVFENDYESHVDITVYLVTDKFGYFFNFSKMNGSGRTHFSKLHMHLGIMESLLELRYKEG